MTDQERAERFVKDEAYLDWGERVVRLKREFAALREECVRTIKKLSCQADCPYLHHEHDTNASYCTAINHGHCRQEICEELEAAIRRGGEG